MRHARSSKWHTDNCRPPWWDGFRHTSAIAIRLERESRRLSCGRPEKNVKGCARRNRTPCFAQDARESRGSVLWMCRNECNSNTGSKIFRLLDQSEGKSFSRYALQIIKTWSGVDGTLLRKPFAKESIAVIKRRKTSLHFRFGIEKDEEEEKDLKKISNKRPNRIYFIFDLGRKRRKASRDKDVGEEGGKWKLKRSRKSGKPVFQTWKEIDCGLKDLPRYRQLTPRPILPVAVFRIPETDPTYVYYVLSEGSRFTIIRAATPARSNLCPGKSSLLHHGIYRTNGFHHLWITSCFIYIIY